MKVLMGILIGLVLVLEGMFIEHHGRILESMMGGPDVFVEVSVSPLQSSNDSASNYDYGSYGGFSDSYEQYELACPDALTLPAQSGMVAMICPKDSILSNPSWIIRRELYYTSLQNKSARSILRRHWPI